MAADPRKTEPVAQPWRDDEPNEPKTDPRILAAIEKHAPVPSRVKDLLVATGAVLASVVAAVTFVDNRVQAQTDAGVAIVKAEQKGLESRLATLEQRFDRYEDRHDKQMNLALDALRVPKDVRPPPLDGGAP